MPWHTKEEISKHNKFAACHGGLRRLWSKVANGVLKKNHDKAAAIKIANYVVAKKVHHLKNDKLCGETKHLYSRNHSIKSNFIKTSNIEIIATLPLNLHSVSVFTPKNVLGEHGKRSALYRMLEAHNAHHLGAMHYGKRSEHFIYITPNKVKALLHHLKSQKFPFHYWGNETQGHEKPISKYSPKHESMYRPKKVESNLYV